MFAELPRGRIFSILCNVINYSVFNGRLESLERLLQSVLNVMNSRATSCLLVSDKEFYYNQ